MISWGVGIMGLELVGFHLGQRKEDSGLRNPVYLGEGWNFIVL